MTAGNILLELIDKKKNGIKSFAVLIDPDKVDDLSSVIKLVNLCVENKVDYIFVGGSLIVNDNFSNVISTIKSNSNIPTIIFPGNNIQIDPSADAILFLSLISGRNPDMLIGQHVLSAPILKRSKLEVIPTGYMLINSGNQTSASYMSNTTPIPANKPTIASSTAMAGEMLGLQMIYLDAGSGAHEPVSQKIISNVKRCIDIPLIVGGGINSVGKANNAIEAGADLIVIGNAIEKNQSLLIGVSDKINSMNRALNIH
ncbi:geranylgeranylglyceryl/heptaprenylglyceryl phosphate synthase [Reichenbachiella sp. MALMAid0571]|uniref:geranylgeranylglyceryl/heptaprenylglyceryl phosphate synthase n=1 Tax=Reichenbachiella sp. MALMAid0571 TaxID=3143939 RepID=UPI0032DFC704